MFLGGGYCKVSLCVYPLSSGSMNVLRSMAGVLFCFKCQSGYVCLFVFLAVVLSAFACLYVNAPVAHSLLSAYLSVCLLMNVSGSVVFSLSLCCFFKSCHFSMSLSLCLSLSIYMSICLLLLSRRFCFTSLFVCVLYVFVSFMIIVHIC